MVNYSFVIPHKNTPDLLQKCLDSIPHREDVEIIVVDDKSDPEVVDFAHFPGLNDPHVQVIFAEKSGGCAYATNIAMDHAQGKWIVRGDADDFFNPDIEKAMDEYKDADYDLVFFKGNSIVVPSGELGHRVDHINDFVDEAIATGDFRHLFCTSLPTCRFYRRDFIEKYHLRLHEVRWSTEVTFWAKCAVLAEKYTASPLNVYCLTDSPMGLTKDKSVLCLKTRCEENITEIGILRPKISEYEYMSYLQYRVWYNLYRKSAKDGLRLLPASVRVGGKPFLRQMCKYMLKDVYNDSKWLKPIVKMVKGLKS